MRVSVFPHKIKILIQALKASNYWRQGQEKYESNESVFSRKISASFAYRMGTWGKTMVVLRANTITGKREADMAANKG